jgi:hypothetical protein
MWLATADEPAVPASTGPIKARGEVLHRVSDLTYNRAY